MSGTATTSSRFRVMGSAAEVAVVGGPAGLAERGRELLEDLEATWSRFLTTSDVSRCNTAAGRPVRVHGDTVTLVRTLVEGWYLTGGAFDPTLLVPLVGLGYSSSRHDPDARTVLPPGAARCGRPGEILLDATAGVVVVPAGTVLDPGGAGKGLAADLVCERLLAAGAEGVLVEIGGDLCVRGDAPQPGGWVVAVGDGAGAPVVRLDEGGVATSATHRTRWEHDGRPVHHLLDPATGRPTSEGADDVAEATVVAGTAAAAEVFATAAVVRGVAWAVRELEALGLAGRLVTVAGDVHRTPGWAAFAGTLAEAAR